MVSSGNAGLQRVCHIIPVADGHCGKLDAVGLFNFHIAVVHGVVRDLSCGGLHVDFKGYFLTGQERKGFVRVFFARQRGGGFVVNIDRFRLCFGFCGVRIRAGWRGVLLLVSAAGAGCERRGGHEQCKENTELFAHR